MQRPILLVFLLFAVVGGSAFLWLPVRSRAHVRASEGTQDQPLDRTGLVTGTAYNFNVDATAGTYPQGSLAWMVRDLGSGAVSYETDYDALVHTFGAPGRYVLQALHALRVVAQDTFVVAEGQRFEPITVVSPLMQDSGAVFSFKDGSRGVAERRWTVARGDSTFATGAADAFTWTASDTGEFTVRLQVTMRDRSTDSSETAITVLVPPKKEVEEKPTRERTGPTLEEIRAAELRRQQAEKLQNERYQQLVAAADGLFNKGNYKDALARYKEAARVKREPYATGRMSECSRKLREHEQAEKDRLAAQRKAEAERQAALEAEARRRQAIEDSIRAIVPSCFGDKNTRLPNAFTADVGTYSLRNAEFKGGVTEFTIEVTADCRLTGFKHFGNSKADKNKITVRCLSEGCDKPSPKPTTFIGGQDATTHSVTRNLNMPVLTAGRTYQVRIETTGTAELGFFRLTGTTWQTDAGTIRFAQPTSCVFDLTFVK